MQQPKNCQSFLMRLRSGMHFELNTKLIPQLLATSNLHVLSLSPRYISSDSEVWCNIKRKWAALLRMFIMTCGVLKISLWIHFKNEFRKNVSKWETINMVWKQRTVTDLAKLWCILLVNWSYQSPFHDKSIAVFIFLVKRTRTELSCTSCPLVDGLGMSCFCSEEVWGDRWPTVRWPLVWSAD